MSNPFLYLLILCFSIFSILSPVKAQKKISSKLSVSDSLRLYGKRLDLFLFKETGVNDIQADYNYAPLINDFLKSNQYVIFPDREITIGLDERIKHDPIHMFIQSGNRILFPKNCVLKCPDKMPTQSYMVCLFKSKNVYLEGLHVIGSKVNQGYKTSAFGQGLVLFGAESVVIKNCRIEQSCGDGVGIRNFYSLPCKNIRIDGLEIDQSTRVGLLIASVRQLEINNVLIKNTGEVNPQQVLLPQNALSFEPDNCNNDYQSVKIRNLITVNNYGPVLGTANFVNLGAHRTCGRKNIDIRIYGWKDSITDDNCYGASLDISTPVKEERLSQINLSNIYGVFLVENVTFYRNTKKIKYNDFVLMDEFTDQTNIHLQYRIKNPIYVTKKNFVKKGNSKFKYYFRNSSKLSVIE